MFKLLRKFIVLTVVFVLGLAAGGYLVKQIQPRNFIDIENCSKYCLDSNQFLGLLGSIGIQLEVIPDIVLETDKTIVINYPEPVDPIHYVIIPKKDIKNIEDVTPEDAPYIMDVIAVNRELVKREGLSKYRLMTNGPGYQEVGYIHFHLTGKK